MGSNDSQNRKFTIQIHKSLKIRHPSEHKNFWILSVFFNVETSVINQLKITEML